MIIQIQYSIYYHYSWQVMRCTSTKTEIIQLPFPSPHWAPRCEAISVWTRNCSPFSISSCRCCCCINCSCCCCCHWRSSRNRCSSLVCSLACCCSSKSKAGSSATDFKVMFTLVLKPNRLQKHISLGLKKTTSSFRVLYVHRNHLRLIWDRQRCGRGRLYIPTYGPITTLSPPEWLLDEDGQQ